MSDNHAELIDQIRMEVAKRHNVLLSPEDPVLTLVTVNEVLLGHYINLVDNKLKASNEHALTAAAGLTEAAKQTASRLITDAAGYIRQQGIDAFNEARKAGVAEAAQIVSKANEVAQGVVDEARILRSGALWSAVIAALFASAAIGLALGLAIK